LGIKAASEMIVGGAASSTSGNASVGSPATVLVRTGPWETTSAALVLNSFNVDGGLLITCVATTF
jgi:hypothetical protein